MDKTRNRWRSVLFWAGITVAVLICIAWLAHPAGAQPPPPPPGPPPPGGDGGGGGGGAGGGRPIVGELLFIPTVIGYVWHRWRQR